MGNSCGLGRRGPHVRAVIMGRMRRAQSGNISSGHRVSYVVTTEKALTQKIRQDSKSRNLVLNFIKNDVYDLYFTSKELAALTQLFNQYATVQTDSLSKAMDKQVFFELVKVNSTKSKDEQASNEAVLNELFETFDQDGNGLLDLKEFLLGFSFWREQLSSSSDKCLFAFTLFDKDRSGRMDREEFKHVIRYMLTISSEQSRDMIGKLPSQELQAFVETAFAEADVDGSGHLSVEELLEWLKRSPDTMRALGSTEEALRAAFLIYDKDGNQMLDRVEFAELLHKTHGLDRLQDGEQERKAVTVVLEIFDRVDLDGSGELDFSEFRHWLTHNPEASSAVLYSETKGQSTAGTLLGHRSITVIQDVEEKEERGTTQTAKDSLLNNGDDCSEARSASGVTETVFQAKQATLPGIGLKRPAATGAARRGSDEDVRVDEAASTERTSDSAMSATTKAMNWLLKRQVEKDTQDIVPAHEVQMHAL